ncbi:hypothetical protein DL766_008431 [Monosporascus sp. MC13-8B]|uniref:SHSP domain-containing protein n=1 Tax=Monosporascus cannonballus TaxID=155416 RepID=A0ABY0GUS1_9PEZI|nr:hypothetical protein DL762_010533 [Monosporascus cannonballus]RYP19512.1 hypothetical protein DL766_008431 [Monosporascus sp. MC13-8B]
MPTSYEKYAEFDPPNNVGVIDIELDDGTLRVKGTDIKTSWTHAPVQKKRGLWATCGFSLLFVFFTLLAAAGVFFITLGVVKSSTGHGMGPRDLLGNASSSGLAVSASLHGNPVPVSVDPVVTPVTPELAKRQAYGDEHSIVTIPLPVLSTVNTGYPSTAVQESTTSSSAHATTTTETTQVTETTTAATTSEESVSFGTISTPEGSVVSHTSLATIVDTSVATYLSTSVATHVNASTVPAAVSSSALSHPASNAFSVTVTRTVVPIMGTSTGSLVSSAHTVTSATASATLGNDTIVHPTPSLSSSISSPGLVTTVFQNSTVLSTVHASGAGTATSWTSPSSTGTAYGGPPVQISSATPSPALSGATEPTASTRAVGSTRSTTVTITVSPSGNCTTTSGTRTSTFIFTTKTSTTAGTSTVVVTQTPASTSTVVSNDAVTASGYGSISTEVPGTTHEVTTSQLPTITVSTSVSYPRTPSPSTATTSTVPVQPSSDSDDEGFASTVTVTFTPTSLSLIVVTETTVATIESGCSPTGSHVTVTETAQGTRTTVFVPQISTHTAIASCGLSSTTITETETVTETAYLSELTSDTAAGTTTTTTVQGVSSTGAVGGGGGEYSYSEGAGFTVEGSMQSASTSTPHVLTSVSTWTSTIVHGSPSIITTTVSEPAIPMISISPNTTATMTGVPFATSETEIGSGTTSSCVNSTVYYTAPVSSFDGSSTAVSAIWSTFAATASSGVGVESVGNPTATSTCISSAAVTQSAPSNGTTASFLHRTTTITNTEAFPSVIDASGAATEVTMTGVFGNVTFTVTGATGGVVSATATGGHHGGGGAPNATATVVPVVSDGGDAVKPARVYWGNTNGGSSNACVVMVVAFVCAVMVLF